MSAAEPVRWGILGAAKIALDRVIGPMQGGRLSRIVAIASRDPARAEAVAQRLGIARAFGSYEALLADPGIEAVYIPLPNHLHVPWTERALAAGKHVLVEKPIAMNAAEAERLVDAQKRSGRILVEAFMVLHHPQWQRTLALIAAGRIGTVHAVAVHVSYRNIDPMNIRNRMEAGGGGIMDIGCYGILFARRAFHAEPRRVMALIDRDPVMGTDRHAALVLDFAAGQATIFVSTQLARAQSVRIAGTEGFIEVPIPLNAPDDRPMRIIVDDARDLIGGGAETIEFEVCNQYRLQGDAVSAAIRGETVPLMTLAESIANMRVIDAAFRSERSGRWEDVEPAPAATAAVRPGR